MGRRRSVASRGGTYTQAEKNGHRDLHGDWTGAGSPVADAPWRPPSAAAMNGAYPPLTELAPIRSARPADRLAGRRTARGPASSGRRWAGSVRPWPIAG